MALKICANSVRSCVAKLVASKSFSNAVPNNILHPGLAKPVACMVSTCNRNYYNDKFDPPYLESMKSKIPTHDTINIQMKGYDFALLESYQSLIHSIANTMDIDVEDCWATPATQTKILRYKPRSAVPEAEYNLTIYERNVQIVNVPSTTFALFVEMIQAALPQGVNISVVPHQEEHDEIRYVPDYELDELKTQLNDLVDSRKK